MSNISKFKELVNFADTVINDPKASELIGSAENVSKLLERAAQAADFAYGFEPQLSQRVALEQHAKKLRGMSEKVDKGVGLISKTKAIIGVYKALKYLDASTIRDDRYASAVLFGDLFYHAGTIAEMLPPPTNEYAAVLKAAKPIFIGTVNNMDPLSPNTERGRYLRQILAEMDGESRAR